MNLAAPIRWPRLARSALLVAALATPALAAARAPLPEPEADWAKFLATGNSADGFVHYKLIDVVEGPDTDVDLAPCTEQAGALDAALQRMPVGIALWYAAYRCADLRGDAEAAEHYLAGFSRLARHALAQANDDVDAPPIRVFAYPDIRALVRASGMQPRYSMLDNDRPRHLEYVQALVDAEAGREHLLRFDFLDTLVRTERGDAGARYPGYRRKFAGSLVESFAKAGLVAGKDLQATRAATAADTPAERYALLRAAAEAGGLQSAWEWIYYCVREPTPTCGDGLVDALLPGAEKRHAMALVLLGLAHAEGIGVARDEARAMALVDAADAQLGEGQGAVIFARYQLGVTPGKMSPALRGRLQAAADRGHPLAARLLAWQRFSDTPGYALTDTDLAPLVALEGKGAPQVAGAIGRMLFSAGRYADAAPWIAKGAASGDTAAQDYYALLLDEGYGVERDPAAAMRWRELAAAGGDTDAMRELASRAGNAGDWKAAEQWLLSAMMFEDADAAIVLAGLYAEGHPGLSRPPERGVALLEELDASMDRPALRRALSSMYAGGMGVKQDKAKARALLEKDAENNDRDSQLLLASGLGQGDFGPSDHAGAERWYARAAAGGNVEAIDAYASWLFYGVDTVPSRARGLAMWRGIAADAEHEGDVDQAWNNFAWALCTSRDPASRNPEEGLAVVGRMGEVAVLSLATRDTVAACLAAAGKHAEAAALQQTVVERYEVSAPKDPSLVGMKERLALYRAGKAYIEVVNP